MLAALLTRQPKQQSCTKSELMPPTSQRRLGMTQQQRVNRM